MSRSSRGIDLSFLNGEEARQILKVLERDTQLKKAEKERLSKFQKKNEDAIRYPGTRGGWLEDFQKRKFQSETDISRIPKQPLVHRLKKAMGNNSANTKGSALDVPPAQNPGSTSILEGLRTPFASLFSSFRKSKKQHLKPPHKQQQQQNSSQYDHMTSDAHTSIKAEEMATTQTCNSSLPSEPTNKCLDANIADTMDSTSTWNEELENELLKGLVWDNKPECNFFRDRESQEEQCLLMQLSKENPELTDAGIRKYFYFKKRGKVQEKID